MSERKCRSCGYPEGMINFYDDETEYCINCEWNGQPYIDGLKADNARLKEELERLSNIINAAYDARGSDVFDILEGGIEKGPQP